MNVIAQTRAIAAVSTAREVAALAKPRLSALVICTTAGGMWLAPGRIDFARVVALRQKLKPELLRLLRS